MALTIGVATVIALLGLVGLFRGVRRGLIALAGTLLAAVLVDLWQDRWADWLRESFRPEQPALPTFLLTASIFIGVTVVIGYGGSTLLPRPGPNAKSAGLPDKLLGALVGALNGALLVSYLLRYAAEIWADEGLAAAVAASPVADVLNAWLPWFILALVGTTAVFVLLRTTMRISRALNARPTIAPAAPPAGGQPAGQAAAASSSVASSRSLKEADSKLSSKIDQALNDRR